MIFFLLLYLVCLGLCLHYGAKVAAVLDQLDVNAEVTFKYALAGLFMGIVPGVNILYVFFGGFIAVEIRAALKSAAASERYNAMLKDVFGGK